MRWACEVGEGLAFFGPARMAGRAWPTPPDLPVAPQGAAPRTPDETPVAPLPGSVGHPNGGHELQVNTQACLEARLTAPEGAGGDSWGTRESCRGQSGVLHGTPM